MNHVVDGRFRVVSTVAAAYGSAAFVYVAFVYLMAVCVYEAATT